MTQAAAVTPTQPQAIGIVLVDDHAILRQGLRAILERELDFAVLGEAASPLEAMAVVEQVRPQIVLLDLKLSSASDNEGLALCKGLVAAHPGLGVLVLTTFLDDQLVIEAVQSGARGYVVKDVDTSGLLRAIRDISGGQSAFDARSSAAMVRGLNASTNTSTNQLTPRELEVLQMLATGLTNRDIGLQLFISETTAKFHVGNILRKLGVSRRAEAVYTASKSGLI